MTIHSMKIKTGRKPLPIDRVKSAQVLIRLDFPTAQKLRAAAVARGVTLSAFVREQAIRGIEPGQNRPGQ